MHFRNLLLIFIIATLFSGCSARSKGFFEDIYSATEVRSATNQDYAEIKAPVNSSIIKDDTETKQSKTYTSNTSQVYHGTGTIIDADYDKDVNLYIYAFLKNGTSNPITFYSDKDLKSNSGVVTITVKDNFLTSISTNNTQSTQKTSTKRKRSRIKTPTVEKINTL